MPPGSLFLTLRHAQSSSLPARGLPAALGKLPEGRLPALPPHLPAAPGGQRSSVLPGAPEKRRGCQHFPALPPGSIAPEPASDPGPAAPGGPALPQPPGWTRLPFSTGDAESRRAAAPPPVPGSGILSPGAAGGGGVAPRRPLTLTSPAGPRAGVPGALRCSRAARAAPHGRRDPGRGDPGRGDPGRQHPRRARAGGGAGGYGGEPGQTIPC